MAYSTISSALIAVGKAIKRELWLKTKDNFDDHESRIASLETAGSLIPIFDETIYSRSSASGYTGLLYYQAKQAIKVTKVLVQIYAKGSISSGTIEIDAKKAASLGASFSTIMTTKPSINFATASDYDFDDGAINASLNSLAVDDYLRIDVTTLPTTPLGKFIIIVYGEIEA
jgi:hypothetical protein